MPPPGITGVTRVAALYDVHGNLPALEAVLAEVEDLSVELVVVGGDVALGPLPEATVERLRSLGDRAIFIRGNADRALAEAEPEGWSEDAWLAWRRWAAEQLGPERVGFLAGLPLSASVEVDGLGPTLFCHATPRDDDEIFTRATPEERLRRLLRGVGERVVVCGHTHVQFDRAVDGVRVVNAGSVGMPYEGEPGAYWALLGPSVEHRRTAYDLDRAATEIKASAFPRADEWVHEYVLNSYGAEEATETFERQAREAEEAG